MAQTEPTSLFDIEPDVVALLESWGADNELPPPTP
jgi:hypothetical protein